MALQTVRTAVFITTARVVHAMLITMDIIAVIAMVSAGTEHPMEPTSKHLQSVRLVPLISLNYICGSVLLTAPARVHLLWPLRA